MAVVLPITVACSDAPSAAPPEPLANQVAPEPQEELAAEPARQSTDFPVGGLGWEASQEAQALASDGRFGPALDKIDESIAAAPQSKFYRMVKTHILVRAGRWDDALEEHQAALERTPGAVIPDEIAYTALILDGAGRYTEALEQVDRAMEMGYVSGPYYVFRARLLERCGRLGEAVAACDQAIELFPEYADARHLRAQLLRAMGVEDTKDED